MSEENKALTRRYFEEVFNERNLQAVDELYATDYVLHDPALPQEAQGLEGARRATDMYLQAFPDVRTTVEDQVAEGDKVATRWRAVGTHQGELMGIAPSGNRVVVTGIQVDRISGGKIEETWANYDALGMMQQLGAVPEPGQEEARARAEGEREEEKGLLDKAKDKLTGQ